MTKLYTAQQIRRKYAGKYIEISGHPYEKWDDKTNKYTTLYEVNRVYKEIHENTTRGEDVETPYAYTR